LKLKEITTHLIKYLPFQSSAFCSTLPVSLSANNGTITATVAKHGLKAGNYVLLTGAAVPVTPTLVTYVGKNVSVTTSTPHGLTKGFSQTVTLEGSANPLFNGTFPLKETPAKNTIMFTLPSAPTGTAPIDFKIHNGHREYDGWYKIDSVTPTTIKWTQPNSINGVAIGTPKLNYNFRITAFAGDSANLGEMITKLPKESLWLYVMPDPSSFSRNKSVITDMSNVANAGTAERRFREVHEFSIYVVRNTADTNPMNVNNYEFMDMACIDIYKALVGLKPTGRYEPSALSLSGIVPTQKIFTKTDDGKFIMRLGFNYSEDMTFNNTYIAGKTSPFNHFDASLLNITNDTIAEGDL
jgi:hypothetical protein